MDLTSSQMEELLDLNLDIIENDPGVIALEFEVDEAGDVTALLVVHRDPDAAKPITSPRVAALEGQRVELLVKLVQGDEIVEDLGRPEDEPPIDETTSLSLHHTLGMSGTTVREGRFWGTLCLSGSSIAINMSGRKCALYEPFLLSNSHVFHATRREIKSVDRRHLGTVTCLYDLEKPTTFDAGIARGTSALPADHAFLAFNPGGEPRKIEGLKTVLKGWAIAKQGAKTGWSEGTAKSTARIRIKGHKALYRCWRGTYISGKGDSGSPVLHNSGGRWYLIGIHFASGPYFHSWDNAEVTAKP